MNTSLPQLHWIEDGQARSCRWHAENGSPPPKRVQVADERLNADTAYRLACEGTALLWQGDFHQAKQMLQAMARRIDKKPVKKKTAPATDAQTAFHLHRQAQSQRARVLAMLLIPFDTDYRIPLRRAPDVQQACTEAYGAPTTAFVASLRELLGIIGAHEWRRNGVEVAALGAKIYPHYGVFSPVRGEYIDLVWKARLPSTELAFDIGVGSGVLSAVLAKRGVQKIIATDQDPRALACARDNLERLSLAAQVELQQTDLFPAGKAPLIVCNPPWLPARPNSPVEHAVYDPESRMLRGFLTGVGVHLEPGGEAWLIMSDFAEHLGLRSQEEFWQWIDAGGLTVSGKMDIRPRHPKSTDTCDPLHAARVQEVTSLWRLKLK
ncbi:methyltransferase [Undibacterium oligocarboniphilum]|uniref:Class I SAM-dependent methyltransferase n=1 Tax=Undibacterium oligocarboniphilum TaxID=666702 RepID=A0A850QIB8_9BURK|nr:class I SAM-dependent methyltransferase [Undibacterium oligocarboniphilum]MBC3871827.1 class I SAM-dependent methyltransferase [Undibacterium oligocarboniphilum]NVO79321.1 class I SAM-dependent methyltransferase [Undibacterium oligocarboniphilum]